MKYLLIEPKVKAKAPNIALMKWARWCEINNHDYQYIRGKLPPDISPDKILMSCIFSYNSEKYESTINYYRKLFPGTQIIVGGVFPSLYPDWFTYRWPGNIFTDDFNKENSLQPQVKVHCGLHSEIEYLAPKYDVEIKYEDEIPPYPRDKIVLYASRGCTNKCGYCAVPRLEGSMKSFKSIDNMLQKGVNEIKDPSTIVLYDNNFTEHEYFDDIVNELLKYDIPVDIHGLHVDSFNEHQAEMFAKLKWGSQNTNGTSYLRFSFDKLSYAENIERALTLTKKYDIKSQFFCYMLFNFTDSPADFWWRIRKAQEIVDRVGKTIYLFPQRYEPFKPMSKDPRLQGLKKKQYTGPKWTDEMLNGLVKMYTFIHGFMSVTQSHNLFNWIGRTEVEFINRIKECAHNEHLTKIETTLDEDYPEGIIYE